MDFAPAIAFYEEELARGTTDAERVGWRGGAGGQITNLVTLCDVAGVRDGDRVLDVGCGLGALVDVLDTLGLRVDYTGVDISPKTIDEARLRHPGVAFELRDVLAEPPVARYDVVVCSGTLNYRVPDHERWVIAMIRRMYELAGRALAFNMLSASRPGSLLRQLRDGGQFLRVCPEDVVGICRQLTPDLELHDAWSGTFQVVLRRPPAGSVARFAERVRAGASYGPAMAAVIEYALRRRAYAELRDYLRGVEPSPEVLERLGFAHLDLGEHALAEDVFERARVATPERPEPYVGLARAARVAGRIDDELRWYREAFARNAEHPDAAYGLVLGLAQRGRREEGHALALAVPPGALHDVLVGLTCGDPAQELAALERALAAAPCLLDAIVFVALAYAKFGRLTEARSLWQRAVSLARDDERLAAQLHRVRSLPDP